MRCAHLIVLAAGRDHEHEEHEAGEWSRSHESRDWTGHERGEDHHKTHMMAEHTAAAPFTREMAEKWMSHLQNADGTTGAHWTLEQVKQVIKQKNLAYDPLKLWVAMNAEYSDSCEVNKKHGITSVDYYADAAAAFWLKDKDAVEDKLAAYFEHVVQH